MSASISAVFAIEQAFTGRTEGGEITILLRDTVSQVEASRHLFGVQSCLGHPGAICSLPWHAVSRRLWWDGRQGYHWDQLDLGGADGSKNIVTNLDSLLAAAAFRKHDSKD